MTREIYETLLNNIPDYQHFMTVDEMDDSSRALAAAHPDTVTLFEIGKTREGHPLLCLKIGSGPRNALAFGLPHPNEPIGAMMLEYFTSCLAENAALREALSYTWYIVKAWDADGARKNEGWFKGPFTITNYMRHFFRPAGFQQVDWTFPIDYKELHFHDSIPETEAMKRLIDNIKPTFIYALHNAGFGGVYWYMSEPCPAVYDALHGVPSKYGVPLHLGEPEAPSSEIYASAIYSDLGVADAYDYLERCVDESRMRKQIETWNSGDTSGGYAGRRFGSFTFVAELPYFYDPRIEDAHPSDMTRREAVSRKYRELRAMDEELREILSCLRPALSEDNPYMLAITDFTSDDSNPESIAEHIAEHDPVYEKQATVAEKFDNLLVSKFYKGVLYGMLLRAAESEQLRTDASPDGKENKERLERGLLRARTAFERVANFLEMEMDYRTVPIKNLVGVQLECGLIIADYLQHRREEDFHESA